MMLPPVSGLAFGLIVGAIMRLPGADAVLAAFAINLSVMASLWLGASFTADKDSTKSSMGLETLGAVITYVCAGAALQHNPWWLVAGFAFQVFWAALHIRPDFGAATRSWFASFAVFANLGFIICYLALVNLT